MSRRPAVLSSYRQLLRSTRIAFNGDIPVLSAARSEARKQFRKGREELVDSSDTSILEEIDKRLEHAQSVALLLRSNIVQGVKETDDIASDEGGKYTTGIDGGIYKLRLHKYSELGDNESIKGGKTNLAGTSRRVQWK
ncbi:mitochondrial zinc maintenance protein 1, mitochondrial [Dipodascopsis uninucleata]